jgi:catechol 2,3-dioxygenase-like lactoylglutathione lyase family enzyme
MDRINHVKLVTPEPELVDAFLREVCEIPEGWPLGAQASAARPTPDAPLGPGGELSLDDVTQQRGGTEAVGFITGNTQSRQFQIFKSDRSAFWAICIGTRNIEAAHERCRARGIPATPITVADWNERDNIRNFFCIVGGLMFEVIRVEPKGAS